MIVRICNWGPIEKCEFDLRKSLSVIYGDNNIGKSYAMQVLYLLLKKLLEYMCRQSLVYYPTYKNYYSDSPILQEVSGFIDDEQLPEKDITKIIIDLYTKRLELEWLPEWLNSLENTFGTFSKILEESPCV